MNTNANSSTVPSTQPSSVAALRDDVASLQSELREDLSSLGDRGVRMAKSAGAAAKDVVVRAGHRGSEMVKESTEHVRNTVKHRPITSMAVAAAAGAVVATGTLMWLRRKH